MDELFYDSYTDELIKRCKPSTAYINSQRDAVQQIVSQAKAVAAETPFDEMPVLMMINN